MKTPIINLLITADYELFLGRNFLSNDEVLFEPTRQLIGVCDELDVPVTFFADICSVFAHRKHGLTEYPEKFERQMRVAMRQGHDVQLHIHPHWLFSNYQNGEWDISTEKMYLAELGYDDAPDSAPPVIARGVSYLTELLKPENRDYRCLAFRAAGLALQPQERELIAALLDNGIVVDSSIIGGVKFKLDTVEIDYSQVPAAANWHMSAENGINTPCTSGLIEIPIATFKSDFATRLGFLWRRARSVRMLRGIGISRAERQTGWSNLRTILKYNLRYLYSDPWFNLSCDTKGYNLRMLLDGFDDYVARYQDTGHIFVSMINHPKMMFERQFDLLRSFVTECRKAYGERIRFITCTDAWNNADKILVD
jgi:hypothetical protein